MEVRCCLLFAGMGLCASTELASQESRRLEPSVAVGVSFRHADANALGGDVAMYLQLSATQWWHGPFGARADASLHFFPVGGVATPGCPPTVLCQEQRSLSLIAAGGLSAAYRRKPTDPLTLVAGAGYYRATTGSFVGQGSGGHRSIGAFGTTAGFTVGGAAVGAPSFGIEARIHYLPWHLGEIKWLSSASLAFRL